VLVSAEDVELLGQNDEFGAIGRGRARQPVGRREIAVFVFCGVELYSSGSHAIPSL
jgi:hypothetical protein